MFKYCLLALTVVFSIAYPDIIVENNFSSIITDKKLRPGEITITDSRGASLKFNAPDKAKILIFSQTMPAEKLKWDLSLENRSASQPARTCWGNKGVWTIIGPPNENGKYEIFQIYHPGGTAVTRIDIGCILDRDTTYPDNFKEYEKWYGRGHNTIPAK